jgi:hypothetical protein
VDESRPGASPGEYNLQLAGRTFAAVVSRAGSPEGQGPAYTIAIRQRGKTRLVGNAQDLHDLATAINAARERVEECFRMARSLVPRDAGGPLSPTAEEARQARLTILKVVVPDEGIRECRGRFEVAVPQLAADEEFSRASCRLEVWSDRKPCLRCGDEAALELSAVSLATSRLVSDYLSRGRDTEEWRRDFGFEKALEHPRKR